MRPGASVDELLARARGGSMTAAGRLLSIIERGGRPARELSQLVFPASGCAHVVGITGAPGAGKSTLTSALVTASRLEGRSVAVLAVDPSSPFSGGAILGDRVRMGEHSGDDRVFIRSLATRGHLGGLSVATREAARLLDVIGYELVVIETVGVGQSELEIGSAADSTVVVVNPAWGDEVQAAKAGLMEIADIFVVNKADRAGSEDTCRDLEQLVEMRFADERSWRPPVHRTVATSAEGVTELWATVGAHRRWLEAAGQLEARRLARHLEEVEVTLGAELRRTVAGALQSEAGRALIEDLRGRRIDPAAASKRLLASIVR